MTKSKTDAHIRIPSFNPYEARFPERRVVSRELLHIMKMCRAKGVRVTVEPDDGRKLYYTIEKGLRDVLADPIYIYVIGLPTSFVTNIISSWFFEHFKRKPKNNDLEVVIEFNDSGKKVRYSHTGREIGNRRFEALINELARRRERYEHAQSIPAPSRERPFPILLEHSDKVVGWSNIILDQVALRTDDALITDDETLARVNSGELKGFSIGGLVGSSMCSICKLEYTECNHLTGRKYHRRECINEILQVDLAEVSLVRNPINPLCVIQPKAPHN